MAKQKKVENVELTAEQIAKILAQVNSGQKVTVEIEKQSNYRPADVEPTDAKEKKEAWLEKLDRRVKILTLDRDGNIGPDGKLVGPAAQSRGGLKRSFGSILMDTLTGKPFRDFSAHCPDAKGFNILLDAAKSVTVTYNKALTEKIARLQKVRDNIANWNGIGDMPTSGMTWRDFVKSDNDIENEARENVAAESAS